MEKEEKIISIWEKMCNLTKKEETAINQDIAKRYVKFGKTNNFEVMALLMLSDKIWDEAQREAELNLLNGLVKELESENTYLFNPPVENDWTSCWKAIVRFLKDKEQTLRATKVAKEL